MPFFDPPEFLAEISDQVTQFDFVPLSNCTKFVNQFWFSSNNQRLVHTQIRRVNDRVIDELVDFDPPSVIRTGPKSWLGTYAICVG